MKAQRFKFNLTKGQHQKIASGLQEIAEMSESGKPGGFFAQIWGTGDYSFIEAVVLPKSKAMKIQKIAGVLEANNG